MAEEEGRGTTPPEEGPAAPEAHTATDDVETAKAEARDARAAAEAATKRADAAEAEARKAQDDAERTKADAELVREDSVVAIAAAEADKRTAEMVNERLVNERDSALNERDSALKEKDSALEEKDSAIEEKDSAIEKMNSALKEKDSAVEKREQLRQALDDAEKRDAEDQPKLAIQEFVSQSLVDIMAGVDEAAAARKTVELNGGIAGLLTSVTTIGAATAERRASDRVEFDLAVTVAKSKEDDGEWGVEVQADAKASILGIFKAGGSLGARYQRALTEAMSQQQAHRIRFSVPIVYAVQDDQPSEE